MKRPSFQFYPADWQANSNLRRCSHEERGIWLDVICLLHDQPEYGLIRWPLKEISQAIGCPLSRLKGLASKNILKGSDGYFGDSFIYTPRSGRKDGDPVTLICPQEGPLWYSSRMVKDEYVRKHAGASTRFAAKADTQPDDFDAPSRAPSRRHGDNQGDGSTSSSSSTSTSFLGETPFPPTGPKDEYFFDQHTGEILS